MSRHWYLRKGDDVQGPLTRTELVAKAKAKEILKNMEVSVDQKYWFSAVRLPFFLQQFSEKKKSNRPHRRWRVRRGEKIIGPFTIAELEQFQANGKVVPGMEFSEDDTTWINVQELAIVLEAWQERRPLESLLPHKDKAKKLPVAEDEEEDIDAYFDAEIVLENSKELKPSQLRPTSLSGELKAANEESQVGKKVEDLADVLEVPPQSNGLVPPEESVQEKSSGVSSKGLVSSAPPPKSGVSSGQMKPAAKDKDRKPFLMPGVQLGKCVIEAFIGRGGMGEVYRALHTSLEIKVAVKVLFPEMVTTQPQFTMRFIKEAKIVAKLIHTNVVHVYDCGQEDKYYYIVMEYVEGETLHQRVRREGKMAWKPLLKIARSLAEALEVAQKAGIVHRDIKPANILLSLDNVPKLTDMGLSKDMADDFPDQSLGKGMPLGTPLYMAPEQCLDPSRCDTRTDIYALGSTLYRCLAGENAHTGANAAEVMTRIVQAPPPDFDQKLPEVPVPVRELLRKMLKKKMDQRYQTPTELREAIEKILYVD